MVEGIRIVTKGDEDWDDSYHYNEGTCPVNYLCQTVQVIDESGDNDPHGIFTYVKTEPWRDVRGSE